LDDSATTALGARRQRLRAQPDLGGIEKKSTDASEKGLEERSLLA